MRRRFLQKTTSMVIVLTLLVLQCFPIMAFGAIGDSSLSFLSSTNLKEKLNGTFNFDFNFGKFTNNFKSSLSGMTNSFKSSFSLSGFTNNLKSSFSGFTNKLKTNFNGLSKIKSVNFNPGAGKNINSTGIGTGLVKPTTKAAKNVKTYTIAGLMSFNKEISDGLSKEGLKFNAVYNSKTNSIKVTWQSKYKVVEVRRSVNGATDKLIDRFTGMANSYTDTDVAKGNTYKYLLYVQYDGDYHGIATVTVTVD